MQLWWGFVTALPVGIAACSGSPSSLDDGKTHCKTTFAYETGPKPGYSSPSNGALLLEGSFYPGEAVLLYWSDNNTSATTTSETTSLSYSGLPSGTRTYALYVSCPATDYEFHPWVNFTIK